MPQSKKSSSSSRRATLLEFVGPGVATMRSCRNCSRTSKACRVGESSDKCTECIRAAVPCDLAPLDTARWRRLEDKRKRLKAELREVFAKQQRLLKQIDFVENEQQSMVDVELQNIDELAQQESSASDLPDPLIDLASEQIVFPSLDSDFFTSLAPFDVGSGSPETSGSSSHA